jgi:hypothetical protein
MRMEVHSPVRLTFRLQKRPDEVLDLATAFSKQPDEVRAALLDAIRQVELRSIDIELLRIENMFRLKLITQDWRAPNSLWAVLEACSHGKFNARSARFFYESDQEEGIIKLAIATNGEDNTLHRDLDALSDEDLIRLVQSVKKIVPKSGLNTVGALVSRSVNSKGRAALLS